MKYNLTFTRAEVEHILACLGHRDTGHDGGWYYGNKQKFNERHALLLSRLRSLPTAKDVAEWRGDNDK